MLGAKAERRYGVCVELTQFVGQYSESTLFLMDEEFFLTYFMLEAIRELASNSCWHRGSFASFFAVHIIVLPSLDLLTIAVNRFKISFTAGDGLFGLCDRSGY